MYSTFRRIWIGTMIFLFCFGNGASAAVQDANRNSHILLEGNAALAREYLKNIHDAGQTLKKSLDHEYNTVFSRAVVTQNRVLGEVDGVPTTFDFKGLSLDASLFLTDYSNRGAYNAHEKDFRLLFLQNASWAEAGMFENVAGLDSISTVQGLQYAYAHPETYTIHRITAANAGEIDALALSDNTKANMRAAVAAGNTIITPDKFVEDGNWRGILYVSLDPDWMGNYAIGEQAAQNGGYSVVEFQINTYQDEEGRNQEVNSALVACAGVCNFISHPTQIFDAAIQSANAGMKAMIEFKEGRTVGDALCAFDKDAYDALLNQQDGQGNLIWNPANGLPCLYEEFSFGAVKDAPTSIMHKVLLATSAVKFYSPNKYNRWDKLADILQTFKTRFPDKAINGINDLHWDSGTWSYDSNFVAGTRIGKGVYNPDKQQVFDIKGFRYQKYTSNKPIKDRLVSEILGYPSSTEQDASYPEYGTGGVSQEFMNGAIYDTLNGGGVVIPGKIYDKYKEMGGATNVGFPLMDPAFDGDILFQDFQTSQRIRWNLSDANNVPEVVDGARRIAVIRDFRADEYPDVIEGLQDGFAEMDIVGVSVSYAAGVGIGVATGKIIANYLPRFAVRFGLGSMLKLSGKLVPGIGWVFAGTTIAIGVEKLAPLFNKCRELQPIEFDGKKPAYYCGKLGVYSLAFMAGVVTDIGVGAAMNKFGVTTQAAREGKAALFRNVQNDEQWSVLQHGISGNTNRAKFFENIKDLDTIGHQSLLSDRKMLQYLVDEADDIAGRLRLTRMYDSSVANARWMDYAVPPYKPGTSVSEFIVSQTGAYNKLVRFHGIDNKFKSSWSIHESDIPYLSSGKIDMDKVRSTLNIRHNEPITGVSRYNSQVGDTLAVGGINGGDQNIMQYEIIGFDDLLDAQKTMRFTQDINLTNLLP